MALHVYKPRKASNRGISFNSKQFSRKKQTQTARIFLQKSVKMHLSFPLLALSSLAMARNFDWNCMNSLGPCNNACYRVNCKNTPLPFNYDKDMSHRPNRRTRSGCARQPCTHTHYKSFGNSCDEFPFASVTQGGDGATLRCVDSSENNSMHTTFFFFFKRLLSKFRKLMTCDAKLKVKEVSSRPFTGA